MTSRRTPKRKCHPCPTDVTPSSTTTKSLMKKARKLWDAFYDFNDPFKCVRLSYVDVFLEDSRFTVIMSNATDQVLTVSSGAAMFHFEVRLHSVSSRPTHPALNVANTPISMSKQQLTLCFSLPFD